MSVLNKKILAELKSLMGDDYQTVYDAFLRTAGPNMDKLDSAVSNLDTEKVQAIAHTLKGSSANVGAEKFSMISKEIMDAARDNITSNLCDNMQALREEYNKVIESIKKLKEK